MRLSKIISLAGWGVAFGAVLACGMIFTQFRDMRVRERLTSVQLPVPARNALPDTWAEAPRRILLVGDSRIRRWSPLPAAPGLAFGASGVGGETLGQLERRFDDNVLTITPAPHEMILAIGVNDLVAASLHAQWGEGFQQQVTDVILTRLEGLVDRAEARGIVVSLATIIQAAAPDLLRRAIFWDDSLPGLIDTANGRIRALAARRGLRVIDFNALLDGGTGPLPARYAIDTLHFSPAAYQALNAGLLKDHTSR